MTTNQRNQNGQILNIFPSSCVFNFFCSMVNWFLIIRSFLYYCKFVFKLSSFIYEWQDKSWDINKRFVKCHKKEKLFNVMDRQQHWETIRRQKLQSTNCKMWFLKDNLRHKIWHLKHFKENSQQTIWMADKRINRYMEKTMRFQVEFFKSICNYGK